MARPRMDDVEKRQQVNVRLLPAHREKLSRMAEAAGRPLATEAEAIIATHLARIEATTPQTRKLTSFIETKIAELQDRMKGRWHKSVPAWASVSEMLAHVLDNERPDRADEDEAVQQARKQIREVEKIRIVFVEALAGLGVAVNQDPRLGNPLGARRFTPNPIPRQGSSREWEKASVEAMPDRSTRVRAAAIFDDLIRADAEVDAARDTYAEAMGPYWEAEDSGRRAGRAALGLPASGLAVFLPDPKPRIL